MACLECMNNPMPQPCCPPERNFGQTNGSEMPQVMGYEWANPVDPPLMQTLGLAALTYFANGLRKNSPDDTMRFVWTLGTLGSPVLIGMLWYRYNNSMM